MKATPTHKRLQTNTIRNANLALLMLGPENESYDMFRQLPGFLELQYGQAKQAAGTACHNQISSFTNLNL